MCLFRLLALLPSEVLAVAVLVSPLEVLELLARPGSLEVLVLLLLVLLGVVDAVLHNVLETTNQAYDGGREREKC